MSKLKVFIQANCQKSAIEYFFARIERLNTKYEFLPIKPVHLWTKDEKEVIISLVKEADIFMHQPVFEKNFGFYASENLINYLKAGTKIISFPNLYFKGYHPQALYLKTDEGKKIELPFPYHDINIFNAWKNGISRDEIIDIFFDEKFYEDSYLENVLENSLRELEKREEYTIIKMSKTIREEMKGKKLFHIFNHPTDYLLSKLIDEILIHLGEKTLTEEEKLLFNKEVLGVIRFPIYKSVQNFLQINVPLNLIFKGKVIDIKEMVNLYYDFYEKNRDLFITAKEVG